MLQAILFRVLGISKYGTKGVKLTPRIDFCSNMCRISGDKKSLLKIYHYSDFLLPTSRWTLFLPVSFESKKRETENSLKKETDRLDYTTRTYCTYTSRTIHYSGKGTNLEKCFFRVPYLK